MTNTRETELLGYCDELKRLIIARNVVSERRLDGETARKINETAYCYMLTLLWCMMGKEIPTHDLYGCDWGDLCDWLSENAQEGG